MRAPDRHALDGCREVWRSIPGELRGGFSGVAGLCRDAAGGTIGCRFPEDVVDSDPFEMQTRYRIAGDKWG